jgi:hypothetical protein
MFAVPEAKFLIDGRVPFYGPEFLRRVTNSFSDPPALNALISEYGVDTVVLDHVRADQSAAVEFLSRSSDWVLGQVQDRHSLFVRPERAPSMLPLEVIGAGYRVGRLLDSDVSDAQIEAELRRLSPHQSSDAIRGWVQGLRELRPLARDGARAGIGIARTDEERDSAREAYRYLSEAAAVYPGFTSIELYRGMAALAACDEPAAREALAWAAYSGETRETSLLATEIALRMEAESQRAAAKARILSLARDPRSAQDPWVSAIARDLEARCP